MVRTDNMRRKALADGDTIVNMAGDLRDYLESFAPEWQRYAAKVAMEKNSGDQAVMLDCLDFLIGACDRTVDELGTLRRRVQDVRFNLAEGRCRLAVVLAEEEPEGIDEE